MVPPDSAPLFLCPLMDPYILLAGKSMHLIESIGKIKQIQEGVVHSPSKGTLASSFCSNVGVGGSIPDLYQDLLQAMSERDTPSGGLVRPRGLAESCDYVTGGNREEGEGRGWRVTPLPHYDPVMNSYLQVLMESAEEEPPEQSRGPKIELPESSLVPLNLLIQEKLHPLLRHHYEIVGDHTQKQIVGSTVLTCCI